MLEGNISLETGMESVQEDMNHVKKTNNVRIMIGVVDHTKIPFV
jgi:hypothetical protein